MANKIEARIVINFIDGSKIFFANKNITDPTKGIANVCYRYDQGAFDTQTATDQAKFDYNLLKAQLTGTGAIAWPGISGTADVQSNLVRPNNKNSNEYLSTSITAAKKEHIVSITVEETPVINYDSWYANS